MIHIIATRAAPEQLADMTAMLTHYIKVAVDIRRKVLAGGGAMHADCEAVLLEDGSQQTDVWGANWYPASREIRCESLINIRPKRGNRSMLVKDSTLRQSIEEIVRARLEG